VGKTIGPSFRMTYISGNRTELSAVLAACAYFYASLLLPNPVSAETIYTATLAHRVAPVPPAKARLACDPAVPDAVSFDAQGFGASPELRRLQSAVGNLGQRAFLSRDAAAARCVMSWLEALGGHAGLLCAEEVGPGPFTALHSQGYVRTRAAAAVALAAAQAVDLLGAPLSADAAAAL
jgi:hypothetical protein